MRTTASDKIFAREAVSDIINEWRSCGETISFTNGVFDLLHCGHLYSLESAAKYADRLIVGVNSDSSVRLLDKGSGRPVNNEKDRMMMISGMAAVDAVVLFDESTPLNLIQAIRPDVLVKGADYRLEDIVGRQFAGEVVRVEMVTDYSTSNLVRKIRSLEIE